MSAIDLAILGIILEKPQSAYEIQKDVAYHNYSKWTKISIPSVYKKVLRLQEQGYLQSTIQYRDKAAAKAVYTVTPMGKEYFYELMKLHTSQTIDFLFDFNVVIANLSKIESDKADELLELLHDNIEKSALSNFDSFAGYNCLPLNAKTIFQQQQCLYKALLEWLDQFEAEFKHE